MDLDEYNKNLRQLFNTNLTQEEKNKIIEMSKFSTNLVYHIKRFHYQRTKFRNNDIEKKFKEKLKKIDANFEIFEKNIVPYEKQEKRMSDTPYLSDSKKVEIFRKSSYDNINVKDSRSRNHFNISQENERVRLKVDELKKEMEEWSSNFNEILLRSQNSEQLVLKQDLQNIAKNSSLSIKEEK
jgi:hypothetical protein